MDSNSVSILCASFEIYNECISVKFWRSTFHQNNDALFNNWEDCAAYDN
jgi:hypothetical protein